MNQKIQDAFNKQINAELFSAYLYLSMSAYFESQGLRGMANWMRIQAQEESMHAMKFFNFINERGGKVSLTQIDEPKAKWNSPLDVFEETCQHESKVTGMINELVDLSISEKDHASNAFLQWFITEQVEEESTVQEIAGKLRLVGDHGGMLFIFDREMSNRALPAAPTAQA